MSVESTDALVAMAAGEFDREGTIGCVRQHLDEDPTHPELVYDALRSFCWKLLTARLAEQEMREWHDVFRQSGALLEARGHSDQSKMVNVLSDLTLESARFAAVNRPEEMIRRRYVQEILHAIAASGKEGAWRRDVMERTGLKQANLSRILAHLTSASLVDRRMVGREARLLLTSLARSLLPSSPDGGYQAVTVSPSISAAS